MNENRENAANEAAAAFAGTEASETALAGAKENEAQAALLEGFMGEEDDLFEAGETDLSAEDEEDELILEAEPEDGAFLPENAGGRPESDGAGGESSRSGANDAGGTAGRSGTNGAAGRSGADNVSGADAAAGDAKEGADAAADGTAGKSAGEAALRPGEEPKYKVNLYGQDLEMTVSELVSAAQRGLEHDSMRAQLDAAQQALPALRLVEQYAAANGMTAGQYLQFAGQNMHRQAVENLTQKGVPEETARELVAERVKLEAERRAIAPLVQRLNAEEARKKARDPWLEVTREYPDVTTLPESVLLSVQRGERPIAAMRAWELEQLRAKLSAQEMQLSAQAATLKNRQTTPGSASGAADTKRDAFLDALFGAD